MDQTADGALRRSDVRDIEQEHLQRDTLIAHLRAPDHQAQLCSRLARLAPLVERSRLLLLLKPSDRLIH